MKSLSRILIALICFVPVHSALAAGPVATTAGSNLTAYNPSNANNNQWATMTNGRYDTKTTAKADFGNCNAIILRCAQPKCGNGGCSDYSVATAIVEGCVKSNNSCKQHGEELVQYMTAQLVASSNAKINEQNAALEQARIQAEAQAAAAAASANSEQISQMQSQMMQMQQQMAQQQAQSAQQLQEALAQQQAQSAAALESMKVAATDAAKQTESGVSAYQQEAINRGISTDVLERQKITGQIMTLIEDADISLKAVKESMQASFDYAHCDTRGNNCEGPKRIKTWREKARDFIDPYDNTIDKIYDALITAQTVGIDLSQIYMMLNNACNQWGQYLCPKMEDGHVVYNYDENNSKSDPQVCPKDTATSIQQCIAKCKVINVKDEGDGKKTYTYDEECQKRCQAQTGCVPCSFLKALTSNSEDAVYEGWINADVDAKDNQMIVACYSGSLNSSPFLSRHAKRKNGANLVDIDTLDRWISQVEPSTKAKNEKIELKDYCFNEKQEEELRRISLSKSIKKPVDMCCERIDSGGKCSGRHDLDDCSFIDPKFAICDVHPYNAGIDKIGENATNEDVNNTKIAVGLKITVISQQMYKQYEYLSATLRRLKTQLEKATLTASLEAAGAKSDDTKSSGLVGGGAVSDDKTIHLAGANNCSNFMDFDSAYNCLQTNVSLIKNNVASNTKKACLQLQETVVSADSILDKTNTAKYTDACKSYKTAGKSCGLNSKDEITKCANALNMAVMAEKRDQSQKNKTMIQNKGS